MTNPQCHTTSDKQILKFGRYKWIVLDEIYEWKLLLAQLPIGIRKYHEKWWHGKNYGVTWETSTIRKFLNSKFIEESFSDNEKWYISRRKIQNNNNPWYGTSGGNDTEDSVFLLSIEEIAKYFEGCPRFTSEPVKRGREAKQECETAKIAFNRDPCQSPWVLRTPGETSSKITFIDVGMDLGHLNMAGEKVKNSFHIRPALWFNTRWLHV